MLASRSFPAHRYDSLANRTPLSKFEAKEKLREVIDFPKKPTAS